MMNRRQVIVFSKVLLIIMGLFSCSEEDVISNLSQNKNAIGFSIALDNAQEESRTFSAPIGIKKNMVLRSADSADTLAMDVLELKGVETQLQDRTRGVAVSESNLTSFEVYASKKEKSTSSISSYFKNLRVNRNASTGDCNSVEQHYWPGSIYTLDFISLAPFSPSGLTVNMDNNGIMPISFDYVVPSKATDQTDILVATKNNVAGDFLNDVRLEFQHICSAINVKVGSIPQGVIKSVKFKNVYGEAQYSVQTSNWSDWSSITDFALEFSDDTYPVTGNEEGELINGEDAILMMIPQSLPDDAVIEVVFVHGNTGREVTLTSELKGTVWGKGNSMNYLISITPDCNLEFTTEVEEQDAHYIICQTTFEVSELKEGMEWNLNVSADDGADVTVQLYDDANAFAKQGFWTDKVINNTTLTNESARGANSIAGNSNGTFTALVYLPENNSDKDRTITLSLQSGTSKDVQTIIQKCPFWTGNYGWENVDDNEEGAYGFNWDRKVAYVFPYNLGLFSKYTKNEAKDLINSIISQYNADSYTDIVEYKPSLTATRVYVYLDYSKLNNLSGVDDELNGLQNTITLNSLVGSATTNAFEEALKNTMKEEEGKENENMFRLPNSDEINDLKIPSESGEVDMQSGILNFVLKKNRYYLRRVTNNETGAVTTAPYLKEEDIVWYLPACGQFPSNTNINAANYWSSTAVDDGVNAYLGSGTDKRTNRHKVIAVRNN